MNDRIRLKRDQLREDYRIVTGREVENFFCPILFRDESAALCEGHVINEAFAGSDRRTVLQRQDVDSFFGSRFEADFVLLEERGKHSSAELLVNRDIGRKLRPDLIIDGRSVGHYVSSGPVPAHHTKLLVDRGEAPPIPLVLKLEPSEALSALDGQWEVQVARDVRLPALVSLLKAAHLTMFAMMGYSYAMTAGGIFVGWDILGRFTAANLSEDRQEVTRRARDHFREFANLVRPMLVPPTDMMGTVSDSQLFLCTGTPKPWAMMVLVRTGADLHAILIPVMEDEESGARFARFLKDGAPRFEVKRMRYMGNRWEISKTSRMIDWPQVDFDAPAI